MERESAMSDILEKVRDIFKKESIPQEKQDRLINVLQELKILVPGKGYVPSSKIPS